MTQTNGSTTLMEQSKDDTEQIVNQILSIMPPDLKDALWVCNYYLTFYFQDSKLVYLFSLL